MSYLLLSFHSREDQDVAQWSHRSLEGEIKSYEGRTIVRHFETYLDGKNARILEAGCGLGGWCEWFRRRGNEVIGVEYNEHIVKRAKEVNPLIPILFGNVNELHCPDSSFDAYISLGVIEHFEHGPENVLKEAYRVLKPGGLAFVSTPYLNILRRFISHPMRSIYFIIHRLMGRHGYFWEYRFTKGELESYLQKAGFEILETALDDYELSIRDRHMGLWADWYFLRSDEYIHKLNSLGQVVLRILNRLFPMSSYCCGIMVIARKCR